MDGMDLVFAEEEYVDGKLDKVYIYIYPSKHETFTQCWFNVGLLSKTMGQH